MAIADGTSNCPIVAPHRRLVRVLAVFGTAEAVPFHGLCRPWENPHPNVTKNAPLGWGTRVFFHGSVQMHRPFVAMSFASEGHSLLRMTMEEGKRLGGPDVNLAESVG